MFADPTVGVGVGVGVGVFFLLMVAAREEDKSSALDPDERYVECIRRVGT